MNICCYLQSATL